jgi:hypothetical protein
MNSTVFWDVYLCNPVKVQHFGGIYCLHFQGYRVSHLPLAGYLTGLLSNLEDAGSMFLKMSVNVYWTTWYYIPEDRTLHEYLLF